MSDNINIGVSNADESYRYKMPKLQTKIEGRGNGIKTVITNMSEVGKALHIKPEYPTKFFGVELGAQSKFDAKLDRAIVNGAHQSADLANLLNKFIEIFILCPNCRLPEITLSVKKGLIKIDCAACGYNGNITSSHKLTTYILKNPPVDARAKSKAKARTKADEAVKEKKNSEMAMEKKNDSVISKKSKPKKEKGVDDNIVWFTDTSSEAKDLRRKEEMASMGVMDDIEDRVDSILIADSGLGESDPSKILSSYISEADRSDLEILAELQRLQVAHRLTDLATYSVLLETLLDTQGLDKIAGQLQKKASIIKTVVGNTDAAARSFISAVEVFVCKDHPEALNWVPHMFQAFYDEEILSEDQIITWWDSDPETSFSVGVESGKMIRDKCLKFVDWLKTAEEESEGDEEEEEDE